ncbi:MAG: hypothetical protein LBG16_02535, partial [Elusimicrobiota bacterium]|nr:hypothetical protein [Elusimicrobiota bacterium]
AVERSEAAQIQSLLKSVVNAEQLYYLQNKHFTKNFEDLDITIPFKGTDGGYAYKRMPPEYVGSLRSNGRWDLFLYGYGMMPAHINVMAFNSKGKYEKAGWCAGTTAPDYHFSPAVLNCCSVSDSPLPETYCQQLLGFSQRFDGVGGGYFISYR